MTNPVILLGTQSNGETLPVQVDATGRLVAEGLQGEKGDKGDPGDPGADGVGELPPNPQDGQVLGWENGELVWMNGGGSGFFLGLDYLIIGGGGAGATTVGPATAGGGAGGFYSTLAGDFNPGNVPAPGSKSVLMPADGFSLSLTVGAVGGDTRIIGPDWDQTVIGGGAANTGNTGGSGGGAGYPMAFNQDFGPVGNGTPGQGFGGGTGAKTGYQECWLSEFFCNNYCRGKSYSGGGGGAGGPASDMTAGPGLSSTITGESVTYAAGGDGGDVCDSYFGGPIPGHNNFGSGGGRSCEVQPGVIILRFPGLLEISDTTGDLIYSSTNHSGAQVATFTSGTGSVRFNLKPEVATSTVIDLLRQF